MKKLKTYKQPSIVSGLSIKEILDMDIRTFNKLGYKDMQKIVGRLVSAGNKRLRRMEEQGEMSPAMSYILTHKDSKGYFTTKGKNLNELRAEFARAKGFLQSETSTLRGWKKIKKETVQALNEKGAGLTDESFNEVLEAFEELKKEDKKVAEVEYKYRILWQYEALIEEDLKKQEIEPGTPLRSMAERVKIIKDQLEKIYRQKENYHDTGVSKFITVT